MGYRTNELIAKTESYADRLNDRECSLARVAVAYPERNSVEIEEMRRRLGKARNEVYIKTGENDFANWEDLLSEADELIARVEPLEEVV
jgi:hypothetical protein